MSSLRPAVFRLITLLLALAPAALAQTSSVVQHEQLAQRYLQARQPDMARKEFEIVAAAEPDNVNAQANLGVLLYFAGELEAAEPHLRKALSLDTSQTKLQALLGLCERRNGELEQARKDLAASLPSLQDAKVRKEVGLELVELETASGDLNAAAQAVAQLKATLPTDPEVLYAAYRVYTDLAGESMLDLSVTSPDSAQLHQAMAHELLRERDNAAAISNLRDALKIDPTLPGGHFELAEALSASSDPALKAEAATQYTLALEQNPHDDKTLTRLGDLAAESGNHAVAIRRYNEAMQAQPGNSDAQVGLAHELVETGNPGAALPLLQHVSRDDPSNLLAHYRLSALYRRLHRPEDSRHEVAEYERLKAERTRLRSIYDAMRLQSPQDKSSQDKPLQEKDAPN